MHSKFHLLNERTETVHNHLDWYFFIMSLHNTKHSTSYFKARNL